MSNNQEQLSFYRKMAELQEKLRKSEEEKAGLEVKFQVLAKNGRAMDEARLSSLKQKYARFLEDDKRRKVRNERILTALDKIEKHTAILTAKTERLKLLRRHFDAYMARTYPAWKERIKDTKEMQQNMQNFTPSQQSAPNFGHQIRSPGFQPNFTNPQESFRNYNPLFSNPFPASNITSDENQLQFMNQRFANDQNEQQLKNQQYQQSINQPYLQQQQQNVQPQSNYTSKETENFKTLMKDRYKINTPQFSPSLQSKQDHNFGQKSTALRHGDIENIQRNYNDLAAPLTDSLLDQHTEYNTSRDLLSVTFDDDSFSKDLSKQGRLDENKENKVPVNVNYKTTIPSLNLGPTEKSQQKTDTSEDEEIIIKKLTKISSFDEDISEGRDLGKHDDYNPLDTKLDKDDSEIDENFDDFQPDNRPGTSMGNCNFDDGDDDDFENQPPKPLHHLKAQNLGYHRNDLFQPKAHDLNYIHEEQYPPEEMSNVADVMRFDSRQPEFDDRIVDDAKKIAPLQDFVPVGSVEFDVIPQEIIKPDDEPVDTKVYEQYKSEKIRPPEVQKSPERLDYQEEAGPKMAQNFNGELQRRPQNVEPIVTMPMEFEQPKYVPETKPAEIEPKYSPKSQRSFETEESPNFVPINQPASQRSFEPEDMIQEQRSPHKDVPYEKSNVEPYFDEGKTVHRTPEMAPIEKQYEQRQQEYQEDIPQSYSSQQIATPEKQQHSESLTRQQEIPFDQSYDNQQFRSPEKQKYNEPRQEIPYERPVDQSYENQPIRTPEKQQYSEPVSHQQEIPYEKPVDQSYENQPIRTPEKQQYSEPVSHQQEIPYERPVDESYENQQIRTPEKQQYSEPNSQSTEQNISYARSENPSQDEFSDYNQQRGENLPYGNQEAQYEPEKYIKEDEQSYNDYQQEPIYEEQGEVPEEQFEDRREGFEPQYRGENTEYDQEQYVEQPKYYEEPDRFAERNETIVEEDESVERDVNEEQPQRYESQDMYQANEYVQDDRKEFTDTSRKEYDNQKYDSQENYDKGVAEYYDEPKATSETYKEPNYPQEQIEYTQDSNYPRDERYVEKQQDHSNLPTSEVYPSNEPNYQPQDYPPQQEYIPDIQQPMIEESPEMYPPEDQNYTEIPKQEQPNLQEQSYSEYSDEQRVTPQESQDIPQPQVKPSEGFREMELNAPVSDRGDTDTMAELDSSDFTTTSSDVKPASVASDLHSGSIAQPASQTTSSDEVERQMAALVTPQPVPPVPQAATTQKTAPPKSSPPVAKPSKPAPGSRPSSASSRNKPGSPASSKSVSSSSPTASKSGSVAGSKSAVRSPAAKKPLHK